MELGSLKKRNKEQTAFNFYGTFTRVNIRIAQILCKTLPILLRLKIPDPTVLLCKPIVKLIKHEQLCEHIYKSKQVLLYKRSRINNVRGYVKKHNINAIKNTRKSMRCNKTIKRFFRCNKKASG